MRRTERTYANAASDVYFGLYAVATPWCCVGDEINGGPGSGWGVGEWMDDDDVRVEYEDEG